MVGSMDRGRRISVVLRPDVIERLREAMLKENRSRSNTIETILRKHFRLPLEGGRQLSLEERRKRSRMQF